MKTIHFNTGRKYTVHGQRISATVHDDGVATFFDHDRLVHGEFSPIGEFDRIEVLHAYDHGHYTGSSRAWKDGMMRDGCNSPSAYEAATAAENELLKGVR